MTAVTEAALARLSASIQNSSSMKLSFAGNAVPCTMNTSRPRTLSSTRTNRLPSESRITSDAPSCPAAAATTPGGPGIRAIRSISRGEGAVQDEGEARVGLHTRVSLVPAIAARADAEHPYEGPCVITLAIRDGNPA